MRRRINSSEAKLVKRESDHRARRFRRVALSPVIALQTPADFHRIARFVFDVLHAARANGLAAVVPDERPPRKAEPLPARLRRIDALMHFRRRRGRTVAEKLHHDRIGVEREKPRKMGFVERFEAQPRRMEKGSHGIRPLDG